MPETNPANPNPHLCINQLYQCGQPRASPAGGGARRVEYYLDRFVQTYQNGFWVPGAKDDENRSLVWAVLPVESLTDGLHSSV